MENYTAENGLGLLKLSGIRLPPDEMEIFGSEFNKIYDFSGKSHNFVNSVWKVYSEILPFKAHPNDEQGNFFRHMARDNLFKLRVIDSGISKKLESGTPIEELVKKHNSFF